jgi:TolB-like protein
MRLFKPVKLEENIVIKQVEKICKSEEFRSKQLLCDFLSYITSEHLAGRGERIKGYSIGVDVFGKGEDFDPGEDALVRIHAGRLRRMLDIYYLKSGRNDRVRIEVPKGSYTPVISEISLPDSSSRSSPDMKRDKTYTTKPGVAVLPFKNLTGNSAEDYFALGFSEELSVELSKYEDLTVHNCPTCRLGSDSDTYQRLQKKGIRFVIEGSIVHISTEIKILVKLSDTSEGVQLWAERYNRNLTANDLSEIQEMIAKEASQIVGGEYGIILQKLTLDANRIKPQHLDTYTAVLKYYYFLSHQTPDAAKQAFLALQGALQKDPESAIAMAFLSSMHGNRYSLDYPNAEAAYLEMGHLAERAAEIDPNSSIIKACLVFKCFVYNEKDRFFTLTDEYLSNVSYNSTKAGSMAFHLSLYGGWERGKIILDSVIQTCAGYPKFFLGATTLYHYRLENYEEALIEANKYDVPSLFWGPMLRAAVCGQLNKLEEAAENVTNVIGLKPDFESKAGYLISRYVKEPDLVEHVSEGLRKAGMNL